MQVHFNYIQLPPPFFFFSLDLKDQIVCLLLFVPVKLRDEFDVQYVHEMKDMGVYLHFNGFIFAAESRNHIISNNFSIFETSLVVIQRLYNKHLLVLSCLLYTLHGCKGALFWE